MCRVWNVLLIQIKRSVEKKTRSVDYLLRGPMLGERMMDGMKTKRKMWRKKENEEGERGPKATKNDESRRSKALEE